MSLSPKSLSEPYFQKEQRSGGAKIRTRPSDSPTDKSSLLPSSFLSVTQWVRRASEAEKGELRIAIPEVGEGPARIGTEAAYPIWP